MSEIGYGMWGMGGWTGSDDDESPRSLELAVELGCNFFDTAWAYGDGPQRAAARASSCARHPERGSTPRPRSRPRTASGRRGAASPLDDVFPADYIREYDRAEPARTSGSTAIDLHAVPRLGGRLGRRRALAAGGGRPQARGSHRRRSASASTAGSRGTSCGRCGPALIDAVQVIYNIFDQAPEDELFPAAASRASAVIARVPFDEGTLTGTLTKESRWPADDWRNTYFVPENLAPSVDRAEALRPARACGHDDARAGAALHPLQPRRVDGHPGDAPTGARARERRRRRGRPAGARAARAAPGAPVGSNADRVVAVASVAGRAAKRQDEPRPNRIRTRPVYP